jgi:hypothetical protein
MLAEDQGRTRTFADLVDQAALKLLDFLEIDDPEHEYFERGGIEGQHHRSIRPSRLGTSISTRRRLPRVLEALPTSLLPYPIRGQGVNQRTEVRGLSQFSTPVAADREIKRVVENETVPRTVPALSLSLRSRAIR